MRFYEQLLLGAITLSSFLRPSTRNVIRRDNRCSSFVSDYFKKNSSVVHERFFLCAGLIQQQNEWHTILPRLSTTATVCAFKAPTVSGGHV